MGDLRRRWIASVCLVLGALLGMAGTFAPASLRGIAWGLDGIALIAATAMLTIHYFRRGDDVAATGFLVFALGETLIASGAAMELEASIPTFAAGTGLWAASLALVSSSRILPSVLRIIGFIAAVLFAAVAIAIFSGRSLHPLSRPLPFFAYPFLAFTLFGWAWVHSRRDSGMPRPGS